MHCMVQQDCVVSSCWVVSGGVSTFDGGTYRPRPNLDIIMFVKRTSQVNYLTRDDDEGEDDEGWSRRSADRPPLTYFCFFSAGLRICHEIYALVLRAMEPIVVKYKPGMSTEDSRPRSS